MTCRPANLDDCSAIARIYSAGIAERVATFETEPRTAEEIARWFDHGLPIVVVDVDGDVAAFASASPYSDRCAYSGVVDFSVYVAPEHRRKGAARLALAGLIEAAKKQGITKVTSRVMAGNAPSLALMDAVGFRTVGTHLKHGKLDGVWHDVVTVEYLIEDNLT